MTPPVGHGNIVGMTDYDKIKLYTKNLVQTERRCARENLSWTDLLVLSAVFNNRNSASASTISSDLGNKVEESVVTLHDDGYLATIVVDYESVKYRLTDKGMGALMTILIGNK